VLTRRLRRAEGPAALLAFENVSWGVEVLVERLLGPEGRRRLRRYVYILVLQFHKDMRRSCLHNISVLKVAFAWNPW
jgi:hypothetical protein